MKSTISGNEWGWCQVWMAMNIHWYAARWLLEDCVYSIQQRLSVPSATEVLSILEMWNK